ncbi:MAG: Fic family protein [Campylobacterota bacterium]|nr:Fic family protein [Campylobacterota bacterium]
MHKKKIFKRPTLDQIKSIHYSLIQDEGQKYSELPKEKEHLILSALEGIDHGFGNTEFYPTVCDKAIHILRSIQSSQAFPDGNKRVALSAFEMFLNMNRSQVSDSITQKEKEEFMLAIANKKIGKKHSVKCCIKALKK